MMSCFLSSLFFKKKKRIVAGIKKRVLYSLESCIGKMLSLRSHKKKKTLRPLFVNGPAETEIALRAHLMKYISPLQPILSDFPVNNCAV